MAGSMRFGEIECNADDELCWRSAKRQRNGLTPLTLSRGNITVRYILSRTMLYVCIGRWNPSKDSSPTDSTSTND